MQTLFPYKNRQGDWGYINTLGKFVISPRFVQAFGFDHEFALVVVDGTYRVINKIGELLPLDFDEMESPCDGYSVGWRGDDAYVVNLVTGESHAVQCDSIENVGSGCFLVERSRLWGAIDGNGLEIFPCRFESYPSIVEGGRLLVARHKDRFVVSDWELHELRQFPFDSVDQFYDGRAVVRSGREFGVVNLDGTMHIELQNLEIKYCCNPSLDWWLTSGHGKCGCLILDNRKNCCLDIGAEDAVEAGRSSCIWVLRDNRWSLFDSRLQCVKKSYCAELCSKVGEWQGVLDGQDYWYVDVVDNEVRELIAGE